MSCHPEPLHHCPPPQKNLLTIFIESNKLQCTFLNENEGLIGAKSAFSKRILYPQMFIIKTLKTWDPSIIIKNMAFRNAALRRNVVRWVTASTLKLKAPKQPKTTQPTNDKMRKMKNPSENLIRICRSVCSMRSLHAIF